MNGEVQLIVITSVETQIFTFLNGGTYGLPGNTRVGLLNASYLPALAGQSINLINASNESQLVTISTVDVDQPNSGYTTINFTSALLYDFREVAGGYFYSAIPNEYYLDLFENESISQNWKFQDLTNFTAQGAFSREFRVPFSDNNQKALGSLFDVNTDAGANNYFHYKLPAEIRVDTLPIATGYIRVRKIYKQMNRINEVEIAFYAETPDLVRNIGDKKLVDIADLTTLDEIVSYDIVTTPTSERIWTLCDRGQRWSEGGEANTRSLVTASRPVFAEDLTPALSWWYLFEKIITDAGFELVAGTLNSLLSNYWMPWCNQSSLIGSDSFNSLFFRAYNSAQVGIGNTFTAIPINTELFDNNGDFNTTTYTYTAPGGGWYTFRAILKFSTLFIANPWDIIVALEVNGLTNFNEMFTGSVTNNSIVDCDLRIALNTGDVVRLVVLQSNLPVNTQLYVQAGDGTFNKTLFEINKTELFFGQTIYYNLNAPDMKQIDFVTDVIKMHNCAIVPDRANPTKIYIVPQNSYLGSGATLDWTSKLDTSKDVVIGSTVDLQKSKFQFTYAAGDDIISKQYQIANRIYGDYEAVGYTINPNTTPSDFAIGDQKIQLVTRSTPSGLVKGSGYVIPIFLNDQLEFVAPGARCLYEAGTYDVQLYDDGISAAVNTSVPVLNNYSVLVPELDDYDLNWAPEVPAQPILSNPYNNLFNLYWRTYMNALYSPEARMMEANFALDLKDILTFSFADKIWIQDSYWRIVEISDYKVGMYESTKVKLLKFLEDVEDCASTPVSVSVNGEVNFEDGNGDPVAATQDCCSRYGYNWDEVNAVCWAFTPTGDRPNSGVNGNATSPAPRVIKAAAQTRSIVNSVITGETIDLAIGNKDMLAAGQHLTLTKDVQGSTLLGKNVSTNLPGIHIGGGYRDGVVGSTSPAWAQFGFFVLQKRPTITTSGDVVDLDIEGVPGEYINIDDDNVWSCILNVLIRDNTGASETSIHHFTLDKIGGAANASAITTLNTIGAIGTNVFTFGIDTATNPAEHRINVTVTGGTYPEVFIMNATLQYQQSKLT